MQSFVRLKNDPPSNGQRSPHHWADNNGGINHHNRASPLSNHVSHDNYRGHSENRGRSPRAGRPPQSNSANNAAILAAVQAAGMPMSAIDPADPMSSMNALLAAAQVRAIKLLIHIFLYTTSTASDLQGVKIQVFCSHAVSNYESYEIDKKLSELSSIRNPTILN